MSANKTKRQKALAWCRTVLDVKLNDDGEAIVRRNPEEASDYLFGRVQKTEATVLEETANVLRFVCPAGGATVWLSVYTLTTDTVQVNVETSA